MGGIGSGQWIRPRKRTTVEQCYSLDVNQLARDGTLQIGEAGIIRLHDQYGEPAFSVEYFTVSGHNGNPILRLSYTWQDWHGNTSEKTFIPVQLQTTHPYFGGQRWWFTCPLAIAGTACNRRAAKLHLPPGGRHFGCRACHDLTYRSCQVVYSLEQACRQANAIHEELERLIGNRKCLRS